MRDRITPVILTFNEQENIGRVLDRLSWARDIVVVDSFSDDATLDILARYPQVRLFQRRFDSHAAQWNFAINETSIETDWVLALDADYVLSAALVAELNSLLPDESTVGYRAQFIYRVEGRPLRGTLYPPVTVLYRRERAHYEQDGHTQRVVVDGGTGVLSAKIYHDDRKPLRRWLQSQERYAQLEAEALTQASWSNLGFADRLRKLIVVAPFVVFLYCLFLKGGILDGKPGLYYALQRMVAEALLSLKLLEMR